MEGKLSITRPSRNNGKEGIVIRFKDGNSGIDFLEAEVSYEDFTKCITGDRDIPCEFATRDLDHVGKIKESKYLEVTVDGFRNKKDAIEQINNNIPDGWSTNMYLSSKDSFFERDGDYWAKVMIYRYVEDPNVSKESE